MGVDGQPQVNADPLPTESPETSPEHSAVANTEPDAGVSPMSASPAGDDAKMDLILDIPLEISIELGRTQILVNDLLKLGQGSVIELTKAAGETLEILANQKLIARGEAVVVNDKYGVRLTEVISPIERIERLK